MSSGGRHARGMIMRRRVLGDAHVDRAEAAKSELDQPFQELITEGAWGSVWARSGLSLRDRSLITLALLAGLGNDAEISMHVRATANTGATPEEIMEAMLHVAIYAGVPRANHAIKIVKTTLAVMAAETAAKAAAKTGAETGAETGTETGAEQPPDASAEAPQ